jgi:predicted nucleotidyltransferase
VSWIVLIVAIGGNDMRKVVFEVVSGSHIRNLFTAESDIDKKSFVLPTFEDLYKGEVFKDMQITPEVDTEIHDIRRLENLLNQANITYLEVLFAKEKTVLEDGAHILFGMREDIARMNLKNLFRATMGMYNRQMSDMQKSTSKLTKDLIAKHGYNPKKGVMALHFLRVLKKYHANGFKDFASCIWYEGEEREEFLAYKAGSLSYQEMVYMLEKEFQEIKKLETDYNLEWFNTQDYTSGVNDLLKKTLRDIVRRGLIQ